VLFLSTALIIGAGSYFLKNYRTKYEQKEFDYSKTDSSFYAGEKSDGLKKDSFKITDKKVDYESELLDFSKNKIKSEVDSAKSTQISLNTADISLLTSLPGIGEKTAEKIIELRKKRKGFKSLEELLLVKGIGKSKLDRIRKFLIIE